MKFFKYLILIVLSCFSVNAFAVVMYSLNNTESGAIYSSAQEVCRAGLDQRNPKYNIVRIGDNFCEGYYDNGAGGSSSLLYFYRHSILDKTCAQLYPNGATAGKTATFSKNSPVPTRVCEQTSSGYCIWDAKKIPF